MSWSKKDYCLTAFLIILACIPALYFNSEANSELLKKISCYDLESNIAGIVETITPYLSSGSGTILAKPVKDDATTNESIPPLAEMIRPDELEGTPQSSYLVDKAEQDEEVLAVSRFCRGPVAEYSKRKRRRRVASRLSVGNMDFDLSECDDPDCAQHKKKGMVQVGEPVSAESKSGCSKKRRLEAAREAISAESKGRGKRKRRRSALPEESVAMESKTGCSKKKRRLAASEEAFSEAISEAASDTISEAISEATSEAISAEIKSRCSRKRRRVELPNDAPLAVESRESKGKRRRRRLCDEEPTEEADEEYDGVAVTGKYEETAAVSIEDAVISPSAEEGLKLEFCNIMDILTNKETETQVSKVNDSDESPEEQTEVSLAAVGAEIPSLPEVSQENENADDDDSEAELDEAVNEAKVEADEDNDANDDDDEDIVEENNRQITFIGSPPLYA